MRDLMLTGFELSRVSGVPMLYLGNPGVGKTTIVNLWAKRNGYHVESLIGSAFDRSEILGYMVNDGKGSDYLRTKEPEWFHTIIENEKQGIPSVLFIDEIAGAPKDVQASLYRLIFERSIGNGKKLPESTIIASASNYKGNLPVMCDITSPNLNRFCIVNFGPQTFEGLYEEFLQEPEDLEKDLPQFSNLPLSPELKEKSLNLVKSIFNQMKNAYALKDCTRGDFNFKNKQLNNVFLGDYSKDGEVYNFISGRTIGYFKDLFRAMYCIGLTRTEYISKFVDGLIGLGFNSFLDIQELNAYRRFVKELTKDALNQLRGKDKAQDSTDKIFEDDAPIAVKVNTLLQEQECIKDQDLDQAALSIYVDIMKQFQIDSKTNSPDPALDKMSTEELIQKREDYNSIELYKMLLEDLLAPSKNKTVMLKKLDEIIVTYKSFINSCIQTEVA